MQYSSSTTRAFGGVVMMVAALLALGAADPSVPEETDIGLTGWSVAFDGFFYSCDDDRTVYSYTVTVESTAHDLGHFVIGSALCDSVEPLSGDFDTTKTSPFEASALDGVTGVDGFKWPWGQVAGSSITYLLVLEGETGLGPSSFSVSGDGKFATGSIMGPVCQGETLFPEFTKPVDGELACDAPTVDFAQGGLDIVSADFDFTKCTGQGTWTVVYGDVVDGAGITWETRAHALYSVKDDQPPTFIDAPEDFTIECHQASMLGEAQVIEAQDNCDAESSINVDPWENIATTDCPDHYYVVRTWTATDECGNSLCHTQTITVRDTEKPTITGTPVDVTYTCEEVLNDPSLRDLPAGTVIEGSDNCDTDVPVTTTTRTIDDECSGTYMIHRSFHAEDNCGNTRSTSYTITVEDVTPPELTFDSTIPSPRTVECLAIPAPQVVTAFDTCGDRTLEVAYTQDPADAETKSGYCMETITRTWTACDDCNNEATHSVTLIAMDKTDPFWTSDERSDYTVECDDVPDFVHDEADDACNPDTLVVDCTEEIFTLGDDCPSEYNILRTCTATDACDNSITRSHTVFVRDTTPPSFVDEPISLTEVECNAIPPFPGNLEVADEVAGCESEITQTSSDTSDNAACTPTITRRWEIHDCANNPYSYTQTIAVVDTTDPTWDTPWDSFTQECTLPTDTPRTATDICQGVINVVGTLVSDITDGCDENRVVTTRYVADDSCGNSISYTQTLTSFDNTPPEFVTTPADISVECHEPFTLEDPTGQDNCGHAVEVVLVSDDTVTDTDCPNAYTRTRTWSLKDRCGNELDSSEYYTQTITVTDQTEPTLDNTPLDTTYPCDEIECPEDVTASDLCEGIDLSYTEEVMEAVPSTCEHRSDLVRVWTATDACGLTTTHTQTIKLTDFVAPNYIGEPLEPESIDCNADIVLPTDPLDQWRDNCDEQVTVVPDEEDIVTPFECSQATTHTFRWVASDECGNTNSVSKVYTRFDNTPPSIEPLDDITYECDEIGEEVFPTPGASDDCANTVVPVLESVSAPVTPDPNCPENFSVVRRWIVEDGCGNRASTSHTITYEDTTPPTATCPPEEITATCDDIPPMTTVTFLDNCDTELETSMNEVTEDETCANRYVLVRTWSATDNCNNRKSCTQRVTIFDSTPPTLETEIPDGTDVSADCNDVPKPVSVCAEDNCMPVTLTFKEETDEGICDGNYVLTRTWTADDACNEPVTTSYTVTVTDTTEPELVNVPAGGTEMCDGNQVPTVTSPTCTDDCSANDVTGDTPTVDSTDKCAVTYTWDWECKDGCGNSDTDTTVITIADQDTPTFVWANGQEPAVEVSVACPDLVPAPAEATGNDKCTMATVTRVDDPPADGDRSTSTLCEESWTRTWTVEDECGNAQSVSQVVIVRAPLAPMWDQAEPTNMVIGCNDMPPAGSPQTATDNCDNTFSADPVDSDPVAAGCGEGSDITRTWTITTSCGHTITRSKVFERRDMAPPSLTLPTANTQLSNQCTYPDIGPASATDDCDNDVDVTSPDAVTTFPQDGCPYAPTNVWDFTATDDCDKTTSGSVTEVYTWDKKPTATYTGSDMLEFECHVGATDPVVTWTDGCGNTAGLVPSVDKSTDESFGCPQESRITYIHTATDVCGIAGEPLTVIADLIDNDVPVISFEWEPVDEQVECPFVSPAPAATATDNCGVTTIELIELRLGFDPDNMDCCNYEVVRMWIASDGCTEDVVSMQRITISDTIPPVWSGTPPVDVVFDCDRTVDPPQAPEITWSEAPFGVGYCGADTAATSCTPSPPTLSGPLLTLGTESYSPTGQIQFVRWANGVAFVRGQFQSVGTPANVYDAVFQWDSEITNAEGLPDARFTDALPVECYDLENQLSPSNPLTWRFYPNLSGNLTLVGGGSAPIEFAGAAGSNAQIGTGATGNNALYGLHAEIETTGASPEAGQLYLQLDQCDTSTWTFPELECGPMLTIEEGEETTTNCTGSFSTLYTWKATDKAMNSNQTSMTITSRDRHAPTFDNPEDAGTVTTSCIEGAVPVLMASDTCSDVTVEGPFEVVNSRTTNPNCPYDYSYEREWIATDECGNPARFVQQVNVEDVEDPTIVPGEPVPTGPVQCLTDLPEPITVECDDDCGLESCEPDHSTPDANCAANGDNVKTYSWTAIDECGRSKDFSYTVTVEDTTGPTCNGPCADDSVMHECEDADVDADTVTFTDNCDGVIDVVPSKNVIKESCNRQYTWTYDATDECGNPSMEAYTVTHTHVDSDGPEITVPARRSADDCMSWDSPTGEEEIADLIVTDCSGVESIVFIGNFFIYEGDCLKTVRRVWEATDTCGNTNQAESFIDINDVAGPVLDPASIAPQTILCTEEVPCALGVKANDMCPGIDAEYTETTVTDPDCPHEFVVTRDYTFTDACGNPTDLSYTVTSHDLSDPEWSTPLAERPADVTVNCGEAVPTFVEGDMEATDDCGVVTVELDISTDGQNDVCDKTTTYRWTATDECNKVISWTANVHVVDVTPPMITSSLLDVSTECGEAQPPVFPGTATASDACDTMLDLVEGDSSTPPTCIGTFTETHTWTFTDDCGLQATESQTLTSSDTTPPVIDAWDATLPDAECVEDPVELPSYSDACTPLDLLDENYSEVPTGGTAECPWPYTVTRTLIITDDCDLTATAVQQVTVDDTGKPTITLDVGTELAISANCNDVVPVPGYAASDVCEGDITDKVDYTSDAPNEGDCTWTETRRWYVEDCRGNFDEVIQVITYTDETAPTIETTPLEPQECDKNNDPTIPQATSTDNTCTGEIEQIDGVVQSVDQPNSECADRTITVTYDDLDSCGNAATQAVETYAVEDTTPPVLTGNFDPVEVECGGQVPSAGAVCTDTCHPNPTIEMVEDEVPDNDNCENTREFLETYTCTDGCGNKHVRTRTVRFIDETPPVLDESTLPVSDCFECTDNDDTQGGAFIITDPLVETVSCSGTFSAAGAGTAPCGNPLPEEVGPDGYVIWTSDWLWFNHDVAAGEAEYHVLDAGLDTQRIQFTAPVVAGGSSDGSVVPGLGDFTFDLSVSIGGFADVNSGAKYEFIGTGVGAACYEDGGLTPVSGWDFYGSFHTSTLSGTGACSGASIRITRRGPMGQIGVGANGKNANYGFSTWLWWERISEATVPANCPIPEAISSESKGDINIDLGECEIPDAPIVTIPCPDVAEVTSNTVIETGICAANHVDTVTYTATDCVGLTDTAVRVFTYKDSQAPVVTAPTLPEKLECGDPAPTDAATALDACDPNPTIVGPTEIGRSGDTCDVTVTYEWTATDECLNVGSATATVQYCDETPPVIAAEGETIEHDCTDVTVTVPAIDKYDASVSDTCSDVDFDATTLVPTDNGAACDAESSTTYTWTYFDACGNSATIQDTVIVVDDTPPVLVAEEPQCATDSTQDLFYSVELAADHGVLFSVSDLCTPDSADITLELTGCTSDQDDILLPEPIAGQPGFNEDCFLDEDGTLFLRRETLSERLDGRMYTITARATDPCNNVANSEDTDPAVVALILIANVLAEEGGTNSAEIRGLPEAVSAICSSNAQCEDVCAPCVYDKPYLPELELTNGVQLADRVYDPATDETKFTYTFSAFDADVDYNALTLGLSLPDAEIVGFTDSSDTSYQRFGFQRDSYLSGLTYAVDSGNTGSEYVVTVRGQWEEETIPYEIEWTDGTDIFTSAGTAGGPLKRANTADPATSVSGIVGVNGLVYGDREDTAIVPLGGVIVALQEKTLWSPETYAWTMTASDGSYTFSGLDAAQQYQVVIVEEGLLQASLQGAHRYLTTDTNALVSQYGEPRCVPNVGDTDVNLGFLIDEELYNSSRDRARYLEPGQPLTVRNREEDDTRFNGNSRQVDFWTEQLRLNGLGRFGLMSVDPERLDIYVRIVDAWLADNSFACVTDTAGALSGSTSADVKRVVAVALNHAAGYGLFRPYRELQDLLLRYALTFGCAPTTAVDEMMKKLLSAN